MSVVKDSLSGLDLRSFNLCIACSGGLDSTVLLEAAVWTGLEPSILHINYQLRGEESDQDEAFVRSLAEKHQLKIKVVRCPKELTKGKGINLQEAARTFRHELFQQFIQADPKNRILLAHHKDDQVETFFLQLLRGAGIFGLGGMHPERNGIIRPFLDLSKNDLEDFAIQNQITWREDSSNLESNYRRNLFRNEHIPDLVKKIPSLPGSILLIQETFRNEQQVIREALQAQLKAWEQRFEISYTEWNALSHEQQIVSCNHFNWPYWMIGRIDELESAALSSVIDKSPIFRTKDGFSWNENFEEIHQWEFKIEEVEFLPETFTAWEIYLDPSACKYPPVKSVAEKSDFIHKIGVPGKTSVYKLLKDHGIPRQWRNTYPVFRCGDEVAWIPGIAVSGKHISKSLNQLKIKIYKATSGC